MRILVHDYAGHPFQVQLSRQLAGMGFEVLHAFAGSLQTPRGDLEKNEDDPASLTIREVPMDPRYPQYKYSFLRRRGMERRYGQQVARMISTWKPVVVISSNTPTETQQFILEATLAQKARFVYWLQDFYSIAVDKLLRRRLPVVGKWIGWYYRRLEGLQLRASHHVVAITLDFVPMLTREFQVPVRNIRVIPNWAPLDSLPVMQQDNPWSRRHGLQNQFVFLYTGTLGMKHNPALLLHLARRFENDPAVRVVVISEGLGADWLLEQKQVSGLTNLMLLPYQNFHSMPRVLGTGAVLCAVLDEDAGIFSVPSKVLTYLCAARPLLLAVPPENLAARLVRDHRCGITVPPADVAGFLEAAVQLRHDALLAAGSAANARAYAEATFGIEEIASQFCRLFPASQRPYPIPVTS